VPDWAWRFCVFDGFSLRWCFFGSATHSPSLSLWLLADIKWFIGVGSDTSGNAWAVVRFAGFSWEIPWEELEFVSFPRIDHLLGVVGYSPVPRAVGTRKRLRGCIGCWTGFRRAEPFLGVLCLTGIRHASGTGLSSVAL